MTLKSARVAPVATRAIGISSLSATRRERSFDAEIGKSTVSLARSARFFPLALAFSITSAT